MGEWYEIIENRSRKILVNVMEWICDCSLWQISGIPCKHAISVFTFRRELPVDYVHWYYSKEALKLTYSGSINPIPEEGRWPEFDTKTMEPPYKRSKARRPKKARKRVADEGRAQSRTFFGCCTACKKLGHNIRTCPQKH